MIDYEILAWPIPNTNNDTDYMLFISDSVGADDAKKEAVTYENALKNIGKLIYCIFSSPMNYNDYFPYVVCLLSVQPHFQMTSSVKPLGDFLSNLMWNLFGTEEWKC